MEAILVSVIAWFPVSFLRLHGYSFFFYIGRTLFLFPFSVSTFVVVAVISLFTPSPNVHCV